VAGSLHPRPQGQQLLRLGKRFIPAIFFRRLVDLLIELLRPFLVVAGQFA
jgi:hypothetical protein